MLNILSLIGHSEAERVGEKQKKMMNTLAFMAHHAHNDEIIAEEKQSKIDAYSYLFLAWATTWLKSYDRAWWPIFQKLL